MEDRTPYHTGYAAPEPSPPATEDLVAAAHANHQGIPIGAAYAVWTGGAAGTFAVGIAFYGDSASAWRLVSVGLIVAGIIGLKLAHGSG